ncbi:methyltransferase domain-containing protein [Spirillospora sp. NPDC029432]|uniref:class I SAM-dependent methyltransferase n=1 Tax=Spirillospora sp. NPDC029432 TaxID=3154599 RepID=UPI003452333B
MNASMLSGRAVRERILGLLDAPPAVPDFAPGYLDLLPPSEEAPPSLAQRVMESAFLPQIYERVWRPVGFNLAKGWPIGPDTAQEHALARTWLGLGAERPNANVLDVACGPGNVTRALASGVGEDGLVVGLDLAEGMLARAARDTADPRVGYVRGDAVDLPFRDGSFDAVCCFGALYLIDDPWRALDSMVRVLRPGGRLVVLTSRRPGLPLGRLGGRAIAEVSGLRLFGDGEITGFLRTSGFEEIRQRRYPAMQMVGATRT